MIILPKPMVMVPDREAIVGAGAFVMLHPVCVIIARELQGWPAGRLPRVFDDLEEAFGAHI